MTSKIVMWEDGWRIISDGITKLRTILEGDSTTSFSAEECINIYTTIFNMCTQKDPQYRKELYESYKDSFNLYIEHTVMPCLREKHNDLAFLRELNQRWLNHKVMVKWFSRHFNYLDRYYVTRHRHRHSLPTLNEAGLKCFRNLVYNEIKSRARDTILALIDEEREGSKIDRALVKSIIWMFIELGGEEMELYKDDFEAHMLKSTVTYYSRKASIHIVEDSCPTYMLMAEEFLQREKDRVFHYLHSTSESKLLQETRYVLLFVPVNQLLEKENSGLHVMLRANQVEDLTRMYRLFLELDKGLEPPSLIFKEHVKLIGEALVKEAEEAARHDKAENKGNPNVHEQSIFGSQAFINKVIEVRDKYLSYCDGCFMGSHIFHKALTEAFESFCNLRIDGKPSAEVLATVCDDVLQKNGAFKRLDDDAVEKTLDKIFPLLAYLYEKDLFAEFCREKLARRLLNRGASEEQEKYFLSKLKQHFGSQFTSTMEGMVTDLTLARDNQVEFEKYLADNSHKNQGLGLNVTILTTVYWPSYKSCNLKVPAELLDYIEVYNKYYESRNRHRKLTWIFSLGNCNVIGRFEQNPIELQVSTHQAAILLLFNTSDKMNFQEIMTQLNIPENELKRMLHSLSCGKHKILIKEPNTKIISPTDIFEYNSKFTDKLRKIKVPVPSVEEKKKVVEEVDKDRRYTIDVTIVRIMKSRKVLHHQELVGETLEHLKQMFKPCVKLIKERIDDLLNQEFLERDRSNGSMYRYLA